MGSFSDDTEVVRTGAGAYAADLSHDWDLLPLPQGGVVAAIALRASGLEVDQEAQSLRSCTTVFAGQVRAGPLEVETQVLRRGRSASQVLSTVRNHGAEAGATTVAIFGAARAGPSLLDVVPPDVPPPAACPSYRDPPPPGVESFPPTQFWSRVDSRAALGHAPWDDYEPQGSDVATWLRFDEPPLLSDGALDPLGVVTLADRMPGAVRELLGPQSEPWFHPSADLTVHLFAPLRTEWLLAHDRARWAQDGWASVESLLWDAAGSLVGFATQMMLFTGRASVQHPAPT